jgi:hypothetical protein
MLEVCLLQPFCCQPLSPSPWDKRKIQVRAQELLAQEVIFQP